MQIMPTINISANFAAADAQNYDQNTQSFAEFLDAAEAEDSEETENSEAERTSSAPTADVYSHTTNGHTYTLDEVCFTKKELATLYSELQTQGAPQSTLTGLKKLMELPDGANLGQVVKSLKGTQTTLDLSDEDANDITSLLNNIDPSGLLSDKVLNAIYRDDPQQALRHIMQGLEDMDQSELISCAKDELLALGRGLGLKSANLQSLSELFGNAENLNLNAQSFAKALAPAQDQLLNEKSDKQKLAQAINKTLTPLLNKARQRMEKEASASALKDRNAAHSQVMIDKTVQEHSRHLLNSIIDNGNERVQEQGLNQLKDQPLSQLDILLQNHDPQHNDFLDGQQHQRKSSSWDDLLHKVTVQHQSQDRRNKEIKQPQPIFVDSDFSFNMSLAANNQTQQSGRTSQVSQQVMSQVESGLLTSFKNGSTRLELQLHPQELGAIAVTLTSRNGEVSAHIRADNEQTVEMLQRQVEALKTSLEQQGLRIDKIEVELREQFNANDQTWQDTDQHNSFQEEESRREQLRRLRNLATLDQNTNASGEVEQHMQEDGHMQHHATGILDKVA